jgi:peptide/nickel transport system substrate-binding protein
MARGLPACIALIIVVLAGCGPGSTRVPSAEGGVAAAPAIKTLRMALGYEAQPSQGLFFSGVNGGQSEPMFALHTGLTVDDEVGNPVPRIAERVPTIEGGDWKTSPDGRMEVRWSLRPNVVWHDGVPLTADDYVFGMRVFMDDALPMVRPSHASLISRVSAPDARTLVVEWKGIHILGNSGGPFKLAALPRHLLETLYEGGDKLAFTNYPYFTQQFVGLGPYQLEAWEQGRHIELHAFGE